MAVLVAIGIGVAALALFAALVVTPAAPGLEAPARAELAETGVTNPVTAVLLDYRSYDTLLELVVVLLAAAAAQALALQEPEPAPLSGPLAEAAAGILTPGIVIVAGYLLWIGSRAPGGAFQAASLLAGGLILLETVGKGVPPRRQAPARALAGLGVAAFLFAGIAVAANTGTFLDYPAALAGELILAIETAAVVGIAFALLSLFRAGRTPV
ncbi:MAG: MnhB domain-containing protein [Alphaproteobacteria bacterium]